MNKKNKYAGNVRMNDTDLSDDADSTCKDCPKGYYQNLTEYVLLNAIVVFRTKGTIFSPSPKAVCPSTLNLTGDAL